MSSFARVSSSTRFMSSSSNSAAAIEPNPTWLAQDWADALMASDNGDLSSTSQTRNQIIHATARSLPLLEDASSVPFVCRYRTDIISPLSTRQVHVLWDLVSKHAALESLRNKLLQHIPVDDKVLWRRIQTSTSKAELDDLYAPYKPPSKGSILERIQKDHPELVQSVDNLWDNVIRNPPHPNSLQPRDALVQLLATKISNDPNITSVVMQELQKHCRIQTKLVTNDDSKDNSNKYSNYDNFSSRLVSLRDHQVLAIRRGVNQKCLQMSYDMDASKMEGCIRYQLMQTMQHSALLKGAWRALVLEEAVHLAWTRYLRRRGTSRLWNDKCKLAQERAMQVFEVNLRHALLAPPLDHSPHILAMDPGFQAGIKCAVLHPTGRVLQLETVQFLGNKRERGLGVLEGLLSMVQSKSNHGGDKEAVVVALGNGHGSQEGRALIQEAAKRKGIAVDIQLVNEAGASVWSVTESAKKEFPNEPPAAVASISIGRRLLNPLHELVKVPPRSLGLGMYQHDLSEKELDDKLHLTSVDAVATVGVDANSCSLEILQKVPGLGKLAAKIIKARPLSQRKDLLTVSGLGPKTFENCAAFCRVGDSTEGLDGTLVHPESYELAQWLLKKLQWKLSETPKDIPPKSKWDKEWDTVLTLASEKFAVSRERVLAVLTNLVDTMTQIDPRLGMTQSKSQKAGSLDGCVLLSRELADLSALQRSSPVRGVIATIRTITDFGAFVDFGAKGDGLLHTSKLGPVRLESLLIGQQVGVDILSVMDNKVSLGLTGLNLEADVRFLRKDGQVKGGQQRSFSSSSRQNKRTKNSNKSATKRSFSKDSSSRSSNKRKRAA